MDALEAVSQVLVKKNKAREALARVERHLGSTTDRAAVFSILGDLSDNAGDTQTSIAYFKKSIDSDPNRVSTYLKIGGVYARQNEFSDAIKMYFKAVELAPKLVRPRMMLAMIYEQQEQYDKANEVYQAILAIDGNFAPAANNLAWNIAEHGGNLDVAMRWATMARENDPYNSTVVDTLGWVAYKRGNFPLAINMLEEASRQLRDRNPSVLYRLGMAYLKAGKQQQARQSLTKALALSRDFKGAAEASKILGEIDGGQKARELG
jgi:tetratricopeptide (TPR) repeat protein